MRYFYIDRTNLADKKFSNSFEQITGAAYSPMNTSVDWYIMVDHRSVELFACGGRIAMTSLYFSGNEFCSAELFSETGTTTLLQATVSELITKRNKK